MCGTWAGANATFAQTCSGNCYTGTHLRTVLASTLSLRAPNGWPLGQAGYVVGTGSVYATAYFEIASVRVYSTSSGSTGEATPRFMVSMPLVLLALTWLAMTICA